MDKLLIQFIEVGIFKNVSHAANKLGISQPTLTHNLRKLEERFGVTLLERKSSGVELTEYGELLYDQSLKMYQIYCLTLDKLDFMKHQKRQTIKIGTGHVWWTLLLKDVFINYQHSQNENNLHIEVGNHLKLMELLLDKELDCFIGHEINGLTTKHGVTFIPLLSCSDGYFASQNHPLAHKKIKLEALSHYPLIELTPTESRHCYLLDKEGPKRPNHDFIPLKNNAKYSTNSLVTAIDMLNTSNAIMGKFPLCMTEYFESSGVIPLKVELERNKEIVGLYMLRERTETSAILQLFEDIKQIIINKKFNSFY